MLKQQLTIFKGGPCNMVLCPVCKDVDKELGSTDDYLFCPRCNFSIDGSNINIVKIVDVDWDTPKGYKPSTFRVAPQIPTPEAEN